NVAVTITGQYTNFVQGATQANFGAGISVGGAAEGTLGTVTVTSPTTATAQLVINPAAVPGYRTVTVQTGVQQATLTGGFTIIDSASIPSISPGFGGLGQSFAVTISGQNTHFVQGTTVANFGAGISVGGAPAGSLGPVSVTSPTSATVQLVIGQAAT